jgi:hypothetical protein
MGNTTAGGRSGACEAGFPCKGGKTFAAEKTVSVEVKAITKSAKESINMTSRKHKDHVVALTLKVKAVKNLSRENINMAHRQHKDDVAKLERQKRGLREYAKKQWTQYKERITAVEAKRQSLEFQCSSVSQVETQKLGREMSAECTKGRSLIVTTEALQDQLEDEVNAKEELSGNFALQAEAVAVARKAVKRAKEEHNRFEKRAKAAEKKVEDMRKTMKSLRTTIATLQVNVGTTTKVHSPAPSLLCLPFLKFTFSFLG